MVDRLRVLWDFDDLDGTWERLQQALGHCSPPPSTWPGWPLRRRWRRTRHTWPPSPPATTPRWWPGPGQVWSWPSEPPTPTPATGWDRCSTTLTGYALTPGSTRRRLKRSSGPCAPARATPGGLPRPRSPATRCQDAARAGSAGGGRRPAGGGGGVDKDRRGAGWLVPRGAGGGLRGPWRQADARQQARLALPLLEVTDASFKDDAGRASRLRALAAEVPAEGIWDRQ
jgi:hypothetical protein